MKVFEMMLSDMKELGNGGEAEPFFITKSALNNS